MRGRGSAPGAFAKPSRRVGLSRFGTAANGGPRTQYATGDSITFTYQGPVNYVWYAVNGTAESSLAVQVIARPVEPPPVSDLEQRVLYIETFLRNLFKGF